MKLPVFLFFVEKKDQVVLMYDHSPALLTRTEWKDTCDDAGASEYVHPLWEARVHAAK